MKKRVYFGIIFSLFLFSFFQNVRGYDVILVTSKTQNFTIDKGWQVTNASNTPLLPEHKFTFNAQRNHLYNPSNINPKEIWYNTSNFFIDSELNTTIQVRDFEYLTDIWYNFTKGIGIVSNTEFIYQMYSDYVPSISLYINNQLNLSIEARYVNYYRIPGDNGYHLVFYKNGEYLSFFTTFAEKDSINYYSSFSNYYPNLLTTFKIGSNRFEFNVKALNATIYSYDYELNELLYTDYLKVDYLNSSNLETNFSLKVIDTSYQSAFIVRENVYAENSNWWLSDIDTSQMFFPGMEGRYQKDIIVKGFSETDINTFIECSYINYQKPISWESRFSQNLTVSRYTNTKYFSEFPQIAYQTSYFPVLDTFDIFNVTTNYYVSAWGILYNATIYNRTLFQIFSTTDEFLVSCAWEKSGLLNFTVKIGAFEYPNTIPANATTDNDFIETGLFIINNTYFGISINQNLVVWNLTYVTSVPRTLQVYGSLFRGSEVRDNINISELLTEISTNISNYVIEIPLFAQNFFLSKYRSVTLGQRYSFVIVSPSQDESVFRRNWTFSQSDIYFREAQSRARFNAVSTRFSLAIIYLMKIMQIDTEYSRAEIYNRTIFHNDLAGKKSLQEVRIDIELQYVMLTLDYIVPLTLEFYIKLDYYIFADNKPPDIIESFLGQPVFALFVPIILLIIFPVVFYDASGKKKIFAGLGLLVGIVVNAIVGLIDPILSILFGVIASIIIYLIVKNNKGEL